MASQSLRPTQVDSVATKSEARDFLVQAMTGIQPDTSCEDLKKFKYNKSMSSLSENDAQRKDILLAMYNEHATHVRHHESQRATIATLSVAVISALIGIATIDESLNLWDVPFTLLVTFFGIFSALFVAKSFERAVFHTERLRGFREELDSVFMGGRLRIIKAKSDTRHGRNKKNQILELGRKTRLHVLWVMLFVLITIVGIIMTIISIYNGNSTGGSKDLKVSVDLPLRSDSDPSDRKSSNSYILSRP